MKQLILFLILFLCSSSHLQAQRIEEWLIDSKQYTCKENPANKCFIIKKKDSATWEYLEGDIAGLIYYEGFVYYVQVVVEEGIIGKPKSYSLLKIIERSKSTPQSLVVKKEVKTVKEIVPVSFILNGKTFLISKLNNFVFNGEKSDPFIKFVNGRLDGSTGCNRFKCNYIIDKENCKFSDLMMTKMACLDKKADLENKIREAILKANTIEYKENKVTLFDVNKAILVEYTEKKTN